MHSFLESKARIASGVSPLKNSLAKFILFDLLIGLVLAVLTASAFYFALGMAITFMRVLIILFLSIESLHDWRRC